MNKNEMNLAQALMASTRDRHNEDSQDILIRIVDAQHFLLTGGYDTCTAYLQRTAEITLSVPVREWANSVLASVQPTQEAVGMMPEKPQESATVTMRRFSDPELMDLELCFFCGQPGNDIIGARREDMEEAGYQFATGPGNKMHGIWACMDHIQWSNYRRAARGIYIGSLPDANQFVK